MSLPLLKVESGFREVVKGVLDLWLGWHIWLWLIVVLLLLGLSGLGGFWGLWLLSLGLLLLLLLRWGLVGGLGLGQLWLAVVEDGGELGVVDNAEFSSRTSVVGLSTHVSKYRTTLGSLDRAALSTRPVKTN